jgi:hypothetical protein
MKKTVKSSMKKYQTGGKAPNKTVTKKDGKVIVTYDSKTRTGFTDFFGTAPYPATVRKVYDNKGNLISGTKTTQGNYGSSSTERIKDPKKKTTTAKSTTPKSTTPKKDTTTKKDTKSTTPAYSAVKEIKSRMYPATGTPKTPTKTLNVYAPKPKPATKTPAKPATSAKTVSQLWTEKTGTPWSEAKKQGMSDGTAASNMALMKKLQSGSPMEYTRAYTGPDYSADAAAEAAFGEPKTTMRRGGSVKKKMKSKKK